MNSILFTPYEKRRRKKENCSAFWVMKRKRDSIPTHRSKAYTFNPRPIESCYYSPSLYPENDTNNMNILSLYVICWSAHLLRWLHKSNRWRRGILGVKEKIRRRREITKRGRKFNLQFIVWQIFVRNDSFIAISFLTSNDIQSWCCLT